jgi:predicted nuclease of predicted toxin-antitoxin system
MARTIRFHLDENCHRAIAEGLRRRGVDVTTTPEVGLLTATDEEHAAFCQAQGRVLFTQDRDFLRMHAVNPQHPVSSIATKTRAASATSSRAWS